jgi:molybdopterin-containing oxidoreductase family membrane subunit
MPAVVGVFERAAPVADAARKLRQRGYRQLEVYSPVPSHELDEVVDERPSRVRIFTLIGGLLGAIGGYAMTIWMANDWPLMIGGKPLSSIPPYTIIAFELTILFGGVLTVLGLFAVGRLPRIGFDRAYSRRFSSEEFGLVVRCRDRDVVEVEALLRAQGAREVSLVEA